MLLVPGRAVREVCARARRSGKLSFYGRSRSSVKFAKSRGRSVGRPCGFRGRRGRPEASRHATERRDIVSVRLGSRVRIRSSREITREKIRRPGAVGVRNACFSCSRHQIVVFVALAPLGRNLILRARTVLVVSARSRHTTRGHRGVEIAP